MCGLFLSAISSTVSGKDCENDPETGCDSCYHKLFLLNTHVGDRNVLIKRLTTLFVFVLVA